MFYVYLSIVLLSLIPLIVMFFKSKSKSKSKRLGGGGGEGATSASGSASGTTSASGITVENVKKKRKREYEKKSIDECIDIMKEMRYNTPRFILKKLIDSDVTSDIKSESQKYLDIAMNKNKKRRVANIVRDPESGHITKILRSTPNKLLREIIDSKDGEYTQEQKDKAQTYLDKKLDAEKKRMSETTIGYKTTIAKLREIINSEDGEYTQDQKDYAAEMLELKLISLEKKNEKRRRDKRKLLSVEDESLIDRVIEDIPISSAPIISVDPPNISSFSEEPPLSPLLLPPPLPLSSSLLPLSPLYQPQPSSPPPRSLPPPSRSPTPSSLSPLPPFEDKLTHEEQIIRDEYERKQRERLAEHRQRMKEFASIFKDIGQT